MRILDLDGPILDGKARHYACYHDILKDFGKAPLEIDTYWALKRDGVCSTDILSRSDAAARNDEFMVRWRALIEQPQYLALDRLQPGAADKLAQWNDCILITMRQNEAAVLNQIKNLGIAPHFKQVIVVTDGDKTGRITSARGAIWVGDTEADARAAQAAGIKCYLVENGLRSRTFLSRFPDCILVPSLNEVP